MHAAVVMMELARCREAKQAYLQSCNGQGARPVGAVVTRFECPSSNVLCTDPQCPILTLQNQGDDEAKAEFLQAHPHTHICTDKACTKRTDKHWFHLKTHVHLDGLVFQMAHNTFSDSEVKAIAAAFRAHANVRELRINHCGLSDGRVDTLLSSVRSSPNLQILELYNNRIGCSAMPLGSLRAILKGLRVLKLNGNELGDNGAATLAAGLAEKFAGRTRLEELFINETGITDGGARMLAGVLRNTSVRVLGMRGNRITALGASYIADVLGGGHTIVCTACPQAVLLGSVQKHTKVWYCGCGTAVDPVIDGPVLCHSALHGAPVTLGHCCTEDVRKCSWTCPCCRRGTATDVPTEPSFFETTCPLTELLLRNNPLLDLGAVALSYGLTHNDTLRSLELKKCGLTAVGIKSLIMHGTSLTGLNLNCNSCKDDGALVIAGKLPELQLRTLGLHDNGITAVGGKALCTPLQDQQTLL
eukprot:gene11750-18120_t